MRLKDEGKIRHLAVSNVTEHEVREAWRLTDIVAVQNRYNPTDRESDGLIDMCAREGLAFIPWEPVIDSDDATLGPIAKAHGASVQQVTLAWLLAHRRAFFPFRVPAMSPIWRKMSARPASGSPRRSSTGSTTWVGEWPTRAHPPSAHSLPDRAGMVEPTAAGAPSVQTWS